MSTDRSDITLPPDLRQKSGTGPVRFQEPVYVDSIPPCNNACPAGENIQGWLDKAQAGDFEAAWRILVADNPMPSIHGRVCYHPCESSCNRQHVDDAVSIHAVERFLGDLALENGWVPEISATQRQENPGGRRRSFRPVGRLAPGHARPRSRNPRSRPDGGRHDAFWHSGLPHAARCAGWLKWRGLKNWV